jgi:hyperosmotically inducible periplasmic protein
VFEFGNGSTWFRDLTAEVLKGNLENMNKGKVRSFIVVIALLVFLGGLGTQESSAQAPARLIREIRHELVTLPYYGVFDWLEFEVQPDNTVILRGQVVRPTTKSDAEANVKDVDGVSRVINQIETLPPSPADDRLRVALYRAIYGSNSPLFRYATQSVPPIHIVVNRGRATLKGIVANKSDAQIAYIRARGVPGLFEVRNELINERERPR